MAIADQTRRIDIVVGTKFDGGGIKLAQGEIAKLRADLKLPEVGPLNRVDTAVQAQAIQRIEKLRRESLQAQVNERLALHGLAPPNRAGSDGVDPTLGRLARIAGVPRWVAGAGVAGLAAYGTRLAFEAAQRADDETSPIPGINSIAGIGNARFADQLSDAIPGGKAIGRQVFGFKYLEDIDKQFSLEQELRRKALSGFDSRNSAGDALRASRVGADVADSSRDSFARRSEQARAEQVGKRAELAKRMDDIRAESEKAKIDFQTSDAFKKLDNDSLRKVQGLMIAADAARKQAIEKLKASSIESEREEANILIGIEKEKDAAIENLRRQHADKLTSITNDNSQLRLVIEGKAYAARLEMIKSRENQVQLELIRRLHDENLDPNVDHVASGKRYDMERAASRERQRLATEREKQLEDRSALEERYDFQQQSYDRNSGLSERLKRLGGDNLGADREAITRRRTDEYSAIDKELRQNIEAHSNREVEYRKQAAEKQQAADFEYRLSDAEMQYRLGQDFRVRPTHNTPMGDNRLLTGVGGQFTQGGQDKEHTDLLKKLVAIWQHATPLLVAPNSN